jgi:hypothetical protein
MVPGSWFVGVVVIGIRLVIVGLDVALEGPFPLVGESELARAIWCDFTLNFFARNIKN